MTRFAIASLLALAACADHPPIDDEPDAPPVDAAAACDVPPWRAIECRVLCGSVELGAPGMCPGATSFIACHRECVTMAPAGTYCPLAPQ